MIDWKAEKQPCTGLHGIMGNYDLRMDFFFFWKAQEAGTKMWNLIEVGIMGCNDIVNFVGPGVKSVSTLSYDFWVKSVFILNAR